MLDETAMRRGDMLPGFRVEMPGRGRWTVPGPEYIGGDADRDGWFRVNYGQAMLELTGAEDAAGRLRAELALMICLLARNYRLSPGEYGELFSGDDGPERLLAALRGVAKRHAEGLVAPPPPPTPAAAPRGRWVGHVADRVWGLVAYFPSRPATAMARGV